MFLRVALTVALVCVGTFAQAQDKVLFTAFDGDDWALYTVVPGETPVQRFMGETRGADARNGLLAFADPGGDIYVQDITLTTIASDPIADLPGPCAQPSLAPDTKTLVVACFRFANRQDDGAFYRVDLTDRSVALLYDGPGLQKSPIFSPDGSQIAFVSGFRLSAERVIEHVWVMQADGSEARPVADSSDINIDPSWLDETTLVFSSDMETREQKLWRADLTSGATVPLTSGPSDMEVAAHPDGRLAYLGRTEDRFALMMSVMQDGRAPEVIAVTADDGFQAAHDPIWTREFTEND